MLAFRSVSASGLATAPLSTAPSARLRDLGFAVLPSRIDTALVTRCRTLARERLDALLHKAALLGVDGVETAFSFTEIDHRARLRYDMALTDETDAAWSELCEQTLALAAPVVEAAAGGSAARLCMSGVVTSRPGAALQDWHDDGAAGLYTVFVPLVDVDANADGTEFYPASHVADAGARDAVRAGAAPPSTEAPAALAGQPLVFDYRVLHRGLANPSRERAVAYLVLATDGAYDGQNFCQMSLDDALPAHVEQMCLWSDYE